MRVTLVFDRDKETKNTVRFKERVKEEGTSPVVGTLYVRKGMGADLVHELIVTLENGQ